MNFSENNLYHIYNQGNNKQQIFFNSEDYLVFINKIRQLIIPHTDIIAYCLMPNHFHLLIYTDERMNIKIKQGGLLLDPLTNGIRKLLSGYARIKNSQSGASGSLFRQKTKSKCLSDKNLILGSGSSYQDYFTNCFNYIHQNPLKAKLVKRMEDWEFSSFRDYAGLRNDSICNKELAIKYCSYREEEFIKTSYQILPDHIIENLF